MPQRDYVKASRPKAKNSRKQPARRNSKGAAAKPRKPWLLLTLTAGLIGGFIYFLWYLTQQPAVTTQVAAPAPVAKTPTAAKSKDELPQKPTEEPYQYIKELENKEVKVEVTEQKAGGPYQMQCGSFRVEQQAEAMKAKIAFVGFPSQVRRTEGSNGIWYRVVLGPYDSKRQATADRNRLRQQNINTCQIWNWS